MGKRLTGVFLRFWLVSAASASFIRERYRADRGCSLSTITSDDISSEQFCAFETADAADKYGRLHLQFGESGCQV